MILLNIVAFSYCVSVPKFDEFTETSFPSHFVVSLSPFRYPVLSFMTECIYLILPIN